MLIINQGKQKMEEEYKIIESEKELLQITKIEKDEKWDNTLKLTMKVISNSQYKNRNVFDRITYDPTNAMAWKYLSVRKAAGCPYNNVEGESIDIEALLLNKAVNAKLGIRKGTDGKEYQSISYLKPETPSETAAPVGPFNNVEVIEETTENTEDLPW